MAALDHLRRAGLTVECVADRLRVSPVERITDPMRQFIREHLAELLAELNAAKEDAPLIVSPRIKAPPALTAAAASSEWHRCRDLYINHLMICRACYAPARRHCQTGIELRTTYDSAL